jgi:shikimate kinase
MPRKNIALIGGRGSGKTTLSKLLASKLGRRMYAMDDLIVYEACGQSIPDLVRDRGWHHFRDLEMLVAAKLGSFQGIVIDCGGGVICDQDERDVQSYSDRKVTALKRNSIVVWLDCSSATQLERIGGDPNRVPLTRGKSAREEMEEVMKLRRPWYRKAADYVINTDVNSPEQAVEKIVAISEQEEKGQPPPIT